MKQLPSQEYLNDCFTYDPQTGELFWKERPLHHFKSKHSQSVVNSRFAGIAAGHKHYLNGVPTSVMVFVKGNFYYVHRVVDAIMGVDVPDGFEVDHHSTDPFDNRWTNLRMATSSQNKANTKRRQGRKYDLPKGVHPKRDKFCSKIGWHGAKLNLGTFNTPEEAHAAYCAKATELFGEFARFN